MRDMHGTQGDSSGAGGGCGQEILLYLERTRVTMVWVNDIQIGTYDSLNTPIFTTLQRP